MTSTTVEAATTPTVEATTAAMEPATTVVTTAAMEAARGTTRYSMPTVEAAPTVKAVPVAPTAASVTPTTTTPTPRPSPAIPRATAHKQSAGKPARPIVAVRRTRVRGVAVVTVATHRRPVAVSIRWPDSYAHADLRLRV